MATNGKSTLTDGGCARTTAALYRSVARVGHVAPRFHSASEQSSALEGQSADGDVVEFPFNVRGGQPSGVCCEERLVRQAGGELIDIERFVEAGVQHLRIDQQADLGGLTSEQPTETRVEPTHYGPLR